ncbi:MAG TPA: YfiR family protein [Myxococcota bacterium]|nr:YfiR family protein [Myxococcota bacterium]HRY95669.1 YfiR family protein [Myxococcota bacterium]HSA21277.1 YfiR family protein [Myxococcota bacterium]
MRKAVTIQLATALLASWLLGAQVQAADENLPAKLRVAVLFKTLTYDHKLEANRSNGLKIGVVMMSGNGPSQQEGAATVDAMRTFGDKKVKGLALSVEPLSVTNAQELEAAVATKGCNALYLGPNLGDVVDKAVVLAKARSLVLLAGEAEVVRKGAAIGAVQRAGKPWILVNLKAAAAQGAEMDSRLLRFVEVVE